MHTKEENIIIISFFCEYIPSIKSNQLRMLHHFSENLPTPLRREAPMRLIAPREIDYLTTAYRLVRSRGIINCEFLSVNTKLTQLFFRNLQILLRQSTHPGHIYHVSKYEEDWLRNKKVYAFTIWVVGG